MSQHVSRPPARDPGTVQRLLAEGRLVVEGRVVAASNATLFCRVELGSAWAHCVYKPVAGERPLWDFPDGTLAQRERATFLVSEATGWALVPPTVLRDGPLGPGMCQLWVDTDPGGRLVDAVTPDDVPPGWLRVLDALDGSGRPVTLAHADDPRLRRMALLDAVINNADRKGGHVLLTADDRLLGVDHGVCFHVDDKLRTVLWGWAGRPIGPDEDATLHRLHTDLDGHLGTELAALLTQAEVRSVVRRVARLLETGRFPYPSPDWPAIPWPAF